MIRVHTGALRTEPHRDGAASIVNKNSSYRTFLHPVRSSVRDTPGESCEL